jgi:hypothetical protein
MSRIHEELIIYGKISVQRAVAIFKEEEEKEK